MKRLIVACIVGATGWFVASPSAQAIPVFQVYIDGAVGGTMGADKDTWFSSDDPITLFVVGAYGKHTLSLEDVTLLVSVPQGETGTITFTDIGDGTPALLTAAGLAADGSFNPTGPATLDLLSDIAGADGYDLKAEFQPFNVGSHYPVKDNLSNFLLYSLGSFSDLESPLNNYDGDDGTITPGGSSEGEQKEFSVTMSGFSSIHLDVYGLQQIEQVAAPGFRWRWRRNAGSHDATWNPPAIPTPVIPEPGGLWLMGSGLLASMRLRLGWLLRRRRGGQPVLL